MVGFVVRRLLASIPVLFGISAVVFVVLRLAPGDPAAMLADVGAMSPDEQAALRASLGLDQPLPVQYVAMMTALLAGDLTSLRTGQHVLDLVAQAIPVTLMLCGLSILVGLVVGVSLGVSGARHPGSRTDGLTAATSLVAVSLPTFWVGLWLIAIFATNLRWLPATGLAPIGQPSPSPLDTAVHLILPTIALSLSTVAAFQRFTRGALGETLRRDFVRTAWAKGLAERQVVIGHALRASLVTIISLTAGFIPILLSTSVVVEAVFGIPGLGYLLVNAALLRDYPVVLASTMAAAGIVVVATLAADLAYGIVDPRLRSAS
jgi:peptide/nickel transport system permease protein